MYFKPETLNSYKSLESDKRMYAFYTLFSEEIASAGIFSDPSQIDYTSIFPVTVAKQNKVTDYKYIKLQR